MKRKIPLMILTILILQVLLPLLTIICESEFTIKSIATTTYEATDSNGIIWTYELQDNKAINVKPKDKTTLPSEVIVPSTLDGYTVTSIGELAFYECSSLTSVEIPDSVTYFERAIFAYCSNLRSIKIPNNIISIGEQAFYGCSSLTSIEIPSNIKDIGEAAFYYCSGLTSIEIPSSITSIKNYVFYGCDSLSNVKIPDSVTNIGDAVFAYCRSLISIKIPSNVQSIGAWAFQDCSNLTSLVIPEGVKSLGNATFRGCRNLTNIEIPSSVTSIGKWTFEGCTNLANIEITEGVTSIGSSAFYECNSLTSIEIPKSVTNIETGAFSGCGGLANIQIHEDNEIYSSIDGVIFNKEKTKIICYPAGRTETTYEIPYGVTEIDLVFDGCTNLECVVLPDTLTSIGTKAFNNCINLTNIEIPSSVTSIESDAFRDCSSLKNIVIPEGVNSIGFYAFQGCSSLTSIEMPTNITEIGVGTFYGCSSISNIQIPEKVTSIGSSAFRECRSLLNIEIPSSVTSIGNNAFYECNSLTSIEIPCSVTSIEFSAFSSCKNLKNINVDINNQNYTSENGILFNKEKTKIICYPAGKTEIDYVIPDGVKSIEADSFYGCRNLTSIEIPDSVTNIGSFAFFDCDGLTKVLIPESVTTIENYAFYHSNNLKNLTIPNDAISIGYNALLDCRDVTIYCRSNSTAETYSKENEISYVIDDKKPTVDIKGNTEEWTKENISLTIEAGDEISGLASKAYSFDGGTTWRAENTKTYENHENVVVKVRDNLGNIATQIIEVKIDKENPIIENVEGNPSEWTNKNVTLKINANDSISGLSEDAYSFDGGTTWQAENTKTYKENTDGIVIKVKDKAGNMDTYEEINITKIDKDAPIITSVEGNPSEWTKESVTLKVNASDNLSGLATQAYSFDGGTTWQAENTKTYTENTNDIVIKVKDNMGYITTYEEEIDITKITKLTGIEISNAVDKTEYVAGQVFDKTGLEITATFDNGTTEVVKGYTISPERALTTEDTKVIISYTVNGVTKTIEQEIKVTLLKGDANGDNQVNFRDILVINNHRLGKTQLTGIYLEAADVTGDGIIDFRDILQVNRYRLGKIDSL